MNEKDNRTDRNKENIPAVPPGMWIKCTKCGKLIYRKELEKNKFICMKLVDCLEKCLIYGHIRRFAD